MDNLKKLTKKQLLELIESLVDNTEEVEEVEVEESKPKKRRGRPPKKNVEESEKISGSVFVFETFGPKEPPRSREINVSGRINKFVDDTSYYNSEKEKTPDFIPAPRRSKPKKIKVYCEPEIGGCGKNFMVYNQNLPETYRCDKCTLKKMKR